MIIRSRQDRRQWGRKVTFPLRDCLGNLVPGDRRRQADRRLGSIETEWLEMKRESGHSTFG
jgi:hypothetical protein